MIYVASQLASTYFMSATMDKNQRVLMMVLPVAFVPVLVNFPVGLVIYWVTTNLWTVGQGVVTRQPRSEEAGRRRRSARRGPRRRASLLRVTAPTGGALTAGAACASRPSEAPEAPSSPEAREAQEDT